MNKCIGIIAILFGCLLSIPVNAGSGEAPQDAIKRLTSTYQAYQKEAQIIIAERKPLSEYFTLIQKLENLEKELELLGVVLKKEAKEFSLLPFEMEGYFNQVGDARLTGYASNGDIIAFSAKIEHPDNGEAHATELFWQLYDIDGKPVAGVEKRERTLESGVTKTYAFRFRLDNLAAGTYKVGLSHYLLENPEIIIQKSIPFKIFDAASIKKIVVTDAPKRFEHKSFLTNDKLPHIYMFYSLAKGVKSATATITVTDAKTGDLIASIAREQPAQKDSFGIRLEEGSIKPEQNFKVTVELQTPDGKVKLSETTFAVGYYQASILAPNQLRAGQSAEFAVKVPGQFKPPLTVSLNPSNGLSLSREKNALSGTITGIAGNYDLYSSLGVTVTDSSGRIARGVTSVTIKAKPQPTKENKSAGIRPPAKKPAGKAVESFRCIVKRPGYGTLGFTVYPKVQGGWNSPITILGINGYTNMRWMRQFKEQSRNIGANRTEELIMTYSDGSEKRVPYNCLQHAK